MSGRQRKNSGFKESRVAIFLVIVLLLILGVFFVSAVVGMKKREYEREMSLPFDEARKIRVQVLNASGKNGMGERMAGLIREFGFDVVEIGNAELDDFQETVIVDRVDDKMRHALFVAKALGVKRDFVLPQLDRTLLLEVSVFVGKDANNILSKRRKTNS